MPSNAVAAKSRARDYAKRVGTGLVVLESHPVQYHAPVYRELQRRFNVPVTVIYGNDSSVAGAIDEEFGTTVAWDTDLRSGHTQVFLDDSVPAHGPVGLAREILRATSGLNPFAFLVTGYGNPFDILAALCCIRTGRPVLFRGETTDHAIRRSRVKATIRDRTLRVLYKRFSNLLYIGSQSKTHYERLGVQPAKLTFSPYCVCTEAFTLDPLDANSQREHIRSSLRIGADALVLLYCGKLSHRKGVDLLIPMIDMLPYALRLRAHLVFVGSGALESELRREACQRRLEKQVHFVGFKNQSELSPFYNASDILILPSRISETWGLVVNEALHHGLPCIVSEAVGCAPDLVHPSQTGETFRTGSPMGLCSAVQKSLELLQNKSQTRQACHRLVARYSVEAAASGIAGVYANLVKDLSP